MKLTINRGPSTDEGTFGMAKLDDGPIWRSGELPDRGNAPRMSRIPAATYMAKMAMSPHFGRGLYHLQDVPGRSEILIHWGNFCGDTAKGLKSDFLGCIGLGMAVGSLEVDGHHQQALLRSKEAFAAFMDATAGQDIEVEIADPA